MRIGLLSLLALAACPRPVPPQPPEPAPLPPAPAPLPPPTGQGEVRVVRTVADLAGASGRVTVIGTVRADGDGTAIVLSDGTTLRVRDEGVPEGWDWLVGTPVRVLGTPEQRDGAWWLVDPQTPMPSDVGISL